MGPLSYTWLLAAAAFGASALTVRADGGGDNMGGSGDADGSGKMGGGANLVRDFHTLQDFAKTVTEDPKGSVAGWAKADIEKDPSAICNLGNTKCAASAGGQNALTGIDLTGANLGADLKLDGFMNKLLDLDFFHANSNGFSGTIPDLSPLKKLAEIDLSNNHLSGEFPKSVFGPPIVFLDLRFNQFEGQLPEELFTKTDMDVIFLNNNQFSGPIPPTGNINTRYITLAENQLTGEIPANLANNKALKEIVLSGNKFEGNVPEELCALDLDRLDVSNNVGLKGKLGPKCKALVASKVLNIDGTGLEE